MLKDNHHRGNRDHREIQKLNLSADYADYTD